MLVRLEKLSAEEKKDDVVTFEQLGVDRLFVDESHSYKNLFLYTKTNLRRFGANSHFSAFRLREYLQAPTSLQSFPMFPPVVSP